MWAVGNHERINKQCITCFNGSVLMLVIVVGYVFVVWKKLTGWVFGSFCLGTTTVLRVMALVELGFGFLLILLIANGVCVGCGC